MSRKTYIVTLLKGFAFTADGRTFYQNRPLKVSLEEIEAARLRSMEGGTKFQILDEPRDVAKKTVEVPKTETTRVPVVDDEDPEVDDEPEGEDDEPEGEDEDSETDPHLEAMTVAELRGFLDTIGVEYPSNAKKADLVKLAAEHG